MKNIYVMCSIVVSLFVVTTVHSMHRFIAPSRSGYQQAVAHKRQEHVQHVFGNDTWESPLARDCADGSGETSNACYYLHTMLTRKDCSVEPIVIEELLKKAFPEAGPVAKKDFVEEIRQKRS